MIVARVFRPRRIPAALLAVGLAGGIAVAEPEAQQARSRASGSRITVQPTLAYLVLTEAVRPGLSAAAGYDLRLDGAIVGGDARVHYLFVSVEEQTVALLAQLHAGLRFGHMTYLLGLALGHDIGFRQENIGDRVTSPLAFEVALMAERDLTDTMAVTARFALHPDQGDYASLALGVTLRWPPRSAPPLATRGANLAPE